MDIICARCGKHFSSIEAAREHSGHCKETSKGEPIRWIPAPKSKITPEEWESLMKLINPHDVSPAITPANMEPTAIESKSSKDSTESNTSIPSINSGNSKRITDKKEAVKNKRQKISNYKIQNWLKALLFIFALSMISLGVSVFIGVFIPFWILFIFSLIYSIEKWFYYPTRKHKVIGKLYRLLLNLSLLSLLGLTIWMGIQLFSQQFVRSPLVGSLIFLAGFVIFIWMWRIVSKNSWRWPSMKLTIFSLICLFIIFAFAGVQPFSNYKDSFLAGLSETFSVDETETTNNDNNLQPDVINKNPVTPAPVTPAVTTAPAPVVPVTPDPEEIDISVKIGRIERLVFDYTNDERRLNGLSALIWDDKLAEVAREHSEDMSENDYFSHINLKGEDPGDRASRHGYNIRKNMSGGWYTIGIAENIGKMPTGNVIGIGYVSNDADSIAKAQVKSWMNSPGHRSNILDSDYDRIGVGVSYDGFWYILTQNYY